MPVCRSREMESTESEQVSNHITLCENPIVFEPVNKDVNVFFDDSNRQVFCVRGNGSMGVVVRGPDDKTNITFRMEDSGEVISIKFSYNLKVLAIQRSQKSVEFMNFSDGSDTLEYSQSCKGKTTSILGYNWTSINEVIFITDHGVEFYQVIPEKRTLKSLKTINVSVNWFVWLPESAVLLLSSGTLGNVIHPFHFRAGTVYRLSKFEIDVPVIPKPPKLCLFERDVTMANVYGQLYIVVLRHQPRSPGSSTGAEIVLYQLNRDVPAKKTNVLKLDMSGRFAINIIDNLVVVHHQSSKTSVIYDIKAADESDGFCSYHSPVVTAQPIQETFYYTSSGRSLQMSGTHASRVPCELYSPNWIVFQPNIIIDAKLGFMWYVNIDLRPIVDSMTDRCRMIEFLLRRKDSKMVILDECKTMLMPEVQADLVPMTTRSQADLVTIARVFDNLNQVYKLYQDNEAVQPQMMESQSPRGDNLRRGRSQVLVDQSDMYTHVFSVFEDNKEIKHKFMVAVLVEYIRSLSERDIPVQHYLYELVINTLVQNNCFYQLHQFLQYHVLTDSKPLACLMLSLEGSYPPAYQLALDMLKRLGTADEEIVEVLLSKQQLLTALRFVRSVGMTDSISARKFLETAMNSTDQMTFYTVFKFFEHRNIKLRSNPKFKSGEHCEKYVKHFETVFGAEALSVA